MTALHVASMDGHPGTEWSNLEPAEGKARSRHPYDVSDEKLMACVQNGDEAALDMLIQRHWHSMVHYAMGFTGELAGAEDLAQDTFVRLWLKRHAWRERGSVRGYLYTLLRNSCLTHVKRQRLRMERETQIKSFGDDTPTPFELLQEREVARVLQVELSRLSTRRREIFELVALRGLSYKEVGEVLGIAVPTVANQMSAALRQLRAALVGVSGSLLSKSG